MLCKCSGNVLIGYVMLNTLADRILCDLDHLTFISEADLNMIVTYLHAKN